MTPPIAVPALAVANPPANNDNVGGQSLNVTRNVPDVEIKFIDVENYMIEKEKKESLELFQELKSKMQVLTQKMSKIEELMRRKGMGYLFGFDDILCMEGDKFPNKFKMP